jgi:hypothetical protein
LQLQKIHEENYCDNLINEIKSKTVFLDESYVVSSIVRKNTKILWDDVNNIVDTLYGKGEYQLLIAAKNTELRRIRLEYKNDFGLRQQIEKRRLHELSPKIRKIDNEVESLQNTFKFVHPLSPKLIIGFQPKVSHLLDKLYAFKQTLSTSTPKYLRSSIMQIIDGNLSSYCPGNKIEQHGLDIVLKPYYANQILQHVDILEELMSQKSKYLTSLEAAKNANQYSRCKAIASKLREVEQFNYLIDSIGKKYGLIGRKLKGVKTQLRINGRLADWPDCLVTNISSKNQSWDSRYSQNSVVRAFEVNNASSKNIPAIALGRLHISTEKLSDTIALRGSLSAHQFNKYRPFSLYKDRLDSNYPLYNSIRWP